MTQPNGFCVPYSVRDTPDKGRGVFAESDIAKGTIVWRHIPGQFGVYDEAAFKNLLNGMTETQVVYELTHVFGLADWPHVVIRVQDDGALMNHDARPTLITNMHLLGPPPPDMATGAKAAVEHISEALLGDRYALIATRDIAAGEEFTNDYEAEVYDPPFFAALWDQYGPEEDYL